MSRVEGDDPLSRELAELHDVDPERVAGPHLRTQDIEEFLSDRAGARHEAIELHRIWCGPCSARIERVRRLLGRPLPDARPANNFPEVTREPVASPRNDAAARPPTTTHWWRFAAVAAGLILAVVTTERVWKSGVTGNGLAVATGGTTQPVLTPPTPRGGESTRVVAITVGPKDQLVSFLHEMGPDTQADTVVFVLMHGTTEIWRQTSAVTSSTFSRVAIASLPARLFERGQSYELRYSEGGAVPRSGRFTVTVSPAVGGGS